MSGKGQPHPAPVAAGSLNADYPGTQLGHQGAAEGAVDDSAKIEKRHALQRLRRHWSLRSIGMGLDAVPQAGQNLDGVLSQRRGMAFRFARGSAHVHHRAKLTREADCRNLQIADVAVVDDLGMVQGLLRGQVWLGGGVALPAEEYGHPFVQGLLLDFLQHYPLQDGDGLSVKEGSVLQLGVFVDEVHVQRVHHGTEQPLYHVAQLDPLAVAGAGGQVASGVAAPGADAGVGRVLARPVPHHLAVDPRNVVVSRDRLEHTGLNLLAPARLLPQV